MAFPAGCLVPAGAGYELRDPKACGFSWYLLFEDGKTLDLTAHVSRVRVRLEFTGLTAIPPAPCNIVASVGNDFGQSLLSSKVVFETLEQ